jgi:hypothetical protein
MDLVSSFRKISQAGSRMLFSHAYRIRIQGILGKPLILVKEYVHLVFV